MKHHVFTTIYCRWSSIMVSDGSHVPGLMPGWVPCDAGWGLGMNANSVQLFVTGINENYNGVN